MKVDGQCVCGAVHFQAEGRPLLQVLCHCPTCQLAHGAPVVAGAQFAGETFRYTGVVQPIYVTKAKWATPRFTCTDCGTRVFNGTGKYRTIFPANCQDASWFEPQMHLYWPNRRIALVDHLPKYVDFPTVLGPQGSVTGHDGAPTYYSQVQRSGHPWVAVISQVPSSANVMVKAVSSPGMILTSMPHTSPVG